VFSFITLIALLAATFATTSTIFAASPQFSPPATDFLIKVKTDNMGPSSNTQFTIPTTGGGYNYNVDCDNDGSNDATGQTGDYTCNYGAAGTYTIRISGTFPRIYFNDPGLLNASDSEKLLSVDQWGTGQWSSMNMAFAGCENMTITASDVPDLSNVTDMEGMFYQAESMNANINNWVVSNVTNMKGAFFFATSFNQPLSGWNTANVTNMNNMFAGAMAFNQDISTNGNFWNTAAVTDMGAMFKGASAFNENIRNWDTANVTNMAEMFSDEGFVLPTAFNQDIGDWNTAKVTDMSGMFWGAENFNQDISTNGDMWNTAAVTDMSGMFAEATAFNHYIGSWVTTKVTNMAGMFYGATAFNQDISTNGDMWNTAAVTNMSSMFEGATIFNQDIGNWNTAAVTDMSGMFAEADAFNQDIGSWVTSKVTDMAGLFYRATAFNQDLNNWVTAAVTDMYAMFSFATAFNQDLNNWNTAKVTDMSEMFFGAAAFNGDVSNWNTAAVTDMNGMFAEAASFNQDVSGWNTAKVTDMSGMFGKASAFNQNIGGWNTGAVTDMGAMFLSATAFDQNIGSWNVAGVTDMTDIFDGVTLSVTNYDALLNGWDAQNLKPNVTFDGGNSAYCNGEAARNNMDTADNWTITDAGKNCNLPEIDVLGNDRPIADGDTTPEYADHTEFGQVDATGAANQARTFTIKNTGLIALNLTGGPPRVSLSGSSDFTLTRDATLASIPAGSETIFTITFDPSAQTTQTATVSIDNNDSNEHPYNFNIQGTGTGPAPEMDVTGNAISIPDGDTSPRIEDLTDFGSINVRDGVVAHTYTITNSGSQPLNLTDTPTVTIGGTHANDFNLTTAATTPVATGGGTTTFAVTFNPSAEGLREATISIANDDADENPYNFNIQGTGGVATVDGDDGDDGGGGVLAVRKFNLGEKGGKFMALPVKVIVPPGAVPDGTLLVIERLERDKTDPDSILGDYIYDITFTRLDGVPITSFFPPITVCIKPTTAMLRQVGFNFANLFMLTRHGGGSWGMVSNPYEDDDGYLCVDILLFSFFALGVSPLPETGFAPGVMHSSAEQPANKNYFDLSLWHGRETGLNSIFNRWSRSATGPPLAQDRAPGDFWLEISSLDVELPILGVPLTEYGWDVTWLGDQAGYLEGTAFPTWAGNTAITAHVWSADNTPGPFVDLHTLRHGDRVEIHAWGQVYTYEVREVMQVRPDDLRALPHDDYDVLTLITCQGFDESSGEYAWRLAVRAVLISVE